MTDRRLTTLTAALVVVGVAIAGYLTWVHYAGLEPICAGGGGGCERVQSSSYAELVAVPVALLGLMGYIAIGASLAFPGETGRLGGAFLALVGVGFSAYLTYIELVEIKAVCQWCVASAIVMTALAATTVARALRADGAATPARPP